MAWSAINLLLQTADLSMNRAWAVHVLIRQSLQRINDLLYSVHVPIGSSSHSAALYDATKPARQMTSIGEIAENQAKLACWGGRAQHTRRTGRRLLVAWPPRQWHRPRP